MITANDLDDARSSLSTNPIPYDTKEEMLATKFNSFFFSATPFSISSSFACNCSIVIIFKVSSFFYLFLFILNGLC